MTRLNCKILSFLYVCIIQSMICKIFYRKVTGDVEKMRISKKEEKKCKIVETEKTKEISGGKKWLRGKSGSKILQK